jgi:hypothetical protein
MKILQTKIAVLEEQLRNAVRIEYERGTNAKMKEQSWALYNNSVKELIALAEDVNSPLLPDDLIIRKLKQEISYCEHTIEVILKSNFVDDMDKQDLLNNFKNIEALNHVIKFWE